MSKLKLQHHLLFIAASFLLTSCAITHTSTSKYSNSQPRVVYEYTFNDDHKEVRHGTYRAWDKNGRLKVRGEFRDDVRDGEWTYFHSNGQKRSSGRYEQDRRVGPWSFWTLDGELYAKVTYPESDSGKMTREYYNEPDEMPKVLEDGKLGDFCDKDNIRAVVTTFASRIKYCYERELQTDPYLAGKIIMQWKVGYHGEPLSPSTAKTTVKNRNVEICIEEVVTRMQFLPPQGGYCIINYPFVFSTVD